MNDTFGLLHVWSSGDFVTRTVAITLLFLSIASWSTLLGKAVVHWRRKRQQETVLDAFWRSGSLEEGVNTLSGYESGKLFLPMVNAGKAAHEAHLRNHSRGLQGGLPLHESLTRGLRSGLTNAQVKLESGQTLLATIGATAPFVGLLGTVWGIHHALSGLREVGRVTMAHIAGPVGEALIMTAAGLFVALPAVLAYNAFTRLNRIVLVQLDGFAHDLHAYLMTGERQP